MPKTPDPTALTRRRTAVWLLAALLGAVAPARAVFAATSATSAASIKPAASVTPAKTANTAKTAKTAKASTSAKAPAKPGNRSRQRLKNQAANLALATTTVEALSAAQLAMAARVLTGAADCEFNQRIDVNPVAGQAGHFLLEHRGQRYRMLPQETSTGAVRLESAATGIVWLQIPSKSMLMNAFIGQRLVDGCLHADQRAALALSADPAQGLGIVPGAIPPAEPAPGTATAADRPALDTPATPTTSAPPTTPAPPELPQPPPPPPPPPAPAPAPLEPPAPPAMPGDPDAPAPAPAPAEPAPAPAPAPPPG